MRKYIEVSLQMKKRAAVSAHPNICWYTTGANISTKDQPQQALSTNRINWC
jgi:hypothetical protein